MKVRNLLVALSVMLLPLGLSTAQAAAQVVDGKCTIKTALPKGDAFSISGNTATTTVILTGNCNETIGLSSWNAPAGQSTFQPYNQQKLFTYKMVNVGRGSHNLSIAVNPVCSYQVDVVLGTPFNKNGEPEMPNRKIGAKQVFGAACPAPKQPTPVTPTQPQT